MTSIATPSATPSAADTTRAPRTRRSGPGRYLALARGELSILLRNKVGTFYAVGLAPLMVLLLAAMPTMEPMTRALGPGGFTTVLTSMLAIFGLLMAVYYNLTTAVVARREKLVLKRLIAGESSRGEVLAAVATPNIAIFAAQFALVLAVGCLVFGAPAFTNPVLLVVALALGAVLSVAVSYATGALTRTVEAAQLTTMPGMMLGMLLSGIILPMDMLPAQVVRVLELLPFHPIVELIRLGLAGRTADGTVLDVAGTFGAAARPALVLAAWTVLAVLVMRRTMRWEPRR